MSEQAMWGLLREKTKLLCGMERITEKLNPGVPDVVYQFPTFYGGEPKVECGEVVSVPGFPGPSGWLELKYLPAERVKGHSVRIPWKSADQPFWLQRWARWGGRAGVLLYVKDTGWYYWRAPAAIKWVEWIKGPVVLGHQEPPVPHGEYPTWACSAKLDVAGLLVELRR